ncbi:Plus3 domain-containing protein [Abeliophyllum distichum]|uniref:Plus3 domain-containing protein n=1 Tax=Abeliophyllum distichum TaxID=126358 RepID=A0ABD1PEN7_9LAMI
MSFGSDDSQNQSNVWTNPSIQGESPLSSSSSEAVGEVNQAPSASCPLTSVLDPEERADDPPEGFVPIYEPTMQQGLRLPMNPFFCEVLKDWNLAPCQITLNGWGQMVASYLLWVVTEARENLTTREFESIYRPWQSAGWYNVSPRPGQKWRMATDSPNKVHNWKEMFFFVGGDWEFMLEDPFPHVFIPRRFEKLVANSEEGPMRAEVEVGKAFRFKGVPALRLTRPASGEGSSTQASQHEASGPSQEVAEGTEEVPAQKRKASAAAEGLMQDARKARRTEEGYRSFPSLDGEPEGVGNSTSSASQRFCFCISESREELPTSVMEMLPAHPSIVATSVHSAFESFDAEEAKSKKLAEDLKAMGLEKAQLESDKKALQFKLDLVVTKEADMKAKYEIELKGAKECLKQARDQRRAAEAFQKSTEEAQKSAENRTLVAETVLAIANSSLEVTVADNEKSLAVAKLELEKVRAERADAEAKVGNNWWSGSWKPIRSGTSPFFERLLPRFMRPRLTRVIIVTETKAYRVLTLKEAVGQLN